LKFVPRRLKTSADASRGGHEGWRSRLKGALSAVLVLAGVYVLLGWTAAAVATHVPAGWETRWFGWAPDALELHEQPAADVQALFDHLLEDSTLLDFPYRLYVIDDDEPNAFAIPGGTVAVTRGLLEIVQGETGRALVLAHELGHLQLRHGLQRLGRVLLLQLTLAGVGVDSNALVKNSFGLADLSHSRGQERAADAFGLELVYRRLGTTAGALEFFEKLGEIEDASPLPRTGSFLRTHPLSADRIDDLRTRAAALESGAQT